jgi:hypothetical protein
VAEYRPRPSGDPLEAARSSLQKLRSTTDWDEATPVVHVNVQQAAATRRSTPPPPREGVILVVLRIVGQGVQRMPPLGIVLIFAMLILAWAYLAVHGKAPVP